MRCSRKGEAPLPGIQLDKAEATGTTDAQTEQASMLALALAWPTAKPGDTREP